MTRNTDWRQHAVDTVTTLTEDFLPATEESAAHDLRAASSTVRKATVVPSQDEYDRSAAREQVREAEQTLVEAAHDLLDAAYEVRKLRSGSTLRQLAGKEPLGYSKPDCGVTHDVTYGSRAQAGQMARHLRWPLQLGEDEWAHEKGDRIREPPGREKVEATGVEKYTRTIADRHVAVVLGERPPPI